MLQARTGESRPPPSGSSGSPGGPQRWAAPEPPWVAYEADSETLGELGPAGRAVLGVAALLRADGAAGRRTDLGGRVQSWLAAAARAGPPAGPPATPSTGLTDSADVGRPVGSAESGPSADGRPERRDVRPASAAMGEPASTSATRSTAEPDPGPTLTASVEMPPPHRSSVSFDVDAVRIRSRYASALYLVNLLEWLDLVVSSPGALNAWDLVELCIRVVLGDDIDEDDPLWPVLARLAGRPGG